MLSWVEHRKGYMTSGQDYLKVSDYRLFCSAVLMNGHYMQKCVIKIDMVILQLHVILCFQIIFLLMSFTVSQRARSRAKSCLDGRPEMMWLSLHFDVIISVSSSHYIFWHQSFWVGPGNVVICWVLYRDGLVLSIGFVSWSELFLFVYMILFDKALWEACPIFVCKLDMNLIATACQNLQEVLCVSMQQVVVSFESLNYILKGNNSILEVFVSYYIKCLKEINMLLLG